MRETPPTPPEDLKTQPSETREAILSIMPGKLGKITGENVWLRKEKNGILVGKDAMKKDATITILQTGKKRNEKGEVKEYCFCKFSNASTKSGKETGSDTGWIAADFIRQEAESAGKIVPKLAKTPPAETETTSPITSATQEEVTPEQLAQKEINERWRGVSPDFRRFITDERGNITPPTGIVAIEDCDVPTLNDRDKDYIYECANMTLLEFTHLTHIDDIRLPGELGRVIMPALTDASGIKWGEKVTHVSMPALEKGLPVGKGSKNPTQFVRTLSEDGGYVRVDQSKELLYVGGKIQDIPTAQLDTGIIVGVDGQAFTGTIDERSPLSAPRFKYFGDIKNGVIDGVGEQIFENGARYIGSYQNNKFSGRGRYELASGAVYEGLWENDTPQGEGTYTVNGVEFKGTFTDKIFTCRTGDGANTYATTLAQLGKISRDIRDERVVKNKSDQKISG